MSNKSKIKEELISIPGVYQPVKLFTIDFEDALKIELSNLGGIIKSICIQDRQGNMEDVVLGYDDMSDYLKNPAYMGCIVGRYANRIAEGKFVINDSTYDLACNNHPNHLHGGKVGFNKKVWEIKSVQESDEMVKLKFSYTSMDGEEGFPGKLTIDVTYWVSAIGFGVGYYAITDKDTIINPTQHSYFNLSGKFHESTLNHIVQLDAETFLPIDENSIPLGEFQSVKGTPFDFTTAKIVGQDMTQLNKQIKIGSGYDHCWVNPGGVQELERKIASLYHDESGRYMEVYTTEPGVQLYTGNHLNGEIIGKNKISYQDHAGLCLETQHFPDSPNQNHFPSTVLKVGSVFSSSTSYKFSIR